MRRLLTLIATASSALLLAACGSEGVSVSASSDGTAAQGAQIFATHCSGCHTLGAAGTQGSGNRATRTQGPNLDQRNESYSDVLFAIHNGGFTGSIMPQNVVGGDEAAKVAEFVTKYSGTEVEATPQPAPSAGEQTSTSASK